MTPQQRFTRLPISDGADDRRLCQEMNITHFGDCRETMRMLIAQGLKAQMCVTSPPYFGLRSYMPDVVRLRDDLTEEELNKIEQELCAFGVMPYSG